MRYLSEIRKPFTDKRYVLAFVFLMLLFTFIFSITSDILLFPNFRFNDIANPFMVLLVLLMSVLVSLNGTILLYAYNLKKKSAKATTLAGLIVGFFTTTCPVCQPLWLFWFGLGSVTGFLADISVYLGAISVFFLLVSLHFNLKSLSGKCELL